MVKKSAIVPLRKKGKEYEILLISNKEKNKWIIPKGTIEVPLPSFLSATKEAYEEAGVIGKTHAFSFGTYFRNNQHIPTYLLEVELMLENYEEKSKRVRKWVGVSKLEKYIAEKDLQRLIKKSCRTLSSKSRYFKTMISYFTEKQDIKILKKNKKQITLQFKVDKKEYSIKLNRYKNLLIFSLGHDLKKLDQKMNKSMMAAILLENDKKNLGFWSLYQTKKNKVKIKRSHKTDIYQINETNFGSILQQMIKDFNSLSKIIKSK